MTEPTIINSIEIDGKEIPFESLTEEKRKEFAELIQERAMTLVGYKRKTG